MPKKEDFEAISHLVNNAPHYNFDGYSSNEMHDLVYHSFDQNSPIQLKRPVSDATLNKLPFFRLTEHLLKIIERENGLKLTSLGYLPYKVVEELYKTNYLKESNWHDEFLKQYKEQYFNSISMVHSNTFAAGLVRKLHGKLILTKAAQKLISPEKREALFIKVFETFTEKLPWSEFDLYSQLPIGNHGWAYGIHLLLKFGNEKKPENFYSQKYLLAFPDLYNDLPNLPYSNPIKDFHRCYYIRFFKRFAMYYGFVEMKEEKLIGPRDPLEIKTLDVINELFYEKD